MSSAEEAESRTECSLHFGFATSLHSSVRTLLWEYNSPQSYGILSPTLKHNTAKLVTTP